MSNNTFSSLIWGIPRTNFKGIFNYPFSQDVDTVSKFNKGSKGSRPSPAAARALINLLFNKERHIGVAKCDDRSELLLEISSAHSDTRKVLVFNYESNTLAVASMDADGTWSDKQYVSAEYVSTLHLIYLIFSDSDVSLKWRETQTEFFQNNKGQRITQCSSTSYLLDALYYSIGVAFPNFNFDSDIAQVDDTTDRNGFVDITEEIIGIPGEFEFATLSTPAAVAPKAKKKSSRLDLDDLRAEFSPCTASFTASLPDNFKALIPQKEGALKNYVVPDDLYNDLLLIKDAIEDGDLSGMSAYLSGPPGLGKSLRGVAIAYILQFPLFYLQGNKDITAADFIGAPMADNGVFRTDVDTPLLLAMKYGGMCILDDFTYINEGYTTALLSVFENPFSIRAADGNVVHRHPMCFLYVTANPDCYGSRPLNEAIASRIAIYHNKTREDTPAEQIIQMVMDASKYSNRKEIETMYACYELICNDAKNNTTMMGQATESTLRNLIRWAKQARVLKNPLEAAWYNIIPALNVSKEEEKRIFNTILVPRFPSKYSK